MFYNLSTCKWYPFSRTSLDGCFDCATKHVAITDSLSVLINQFVPPTFCPYFAFTAINFRGITLHHVCDVAFDENMCVPIRTRKCKSTNWLINYMACNFIKSCNDDCLFKFMGILINKFIKITMCELYPYLLSLITNYTIIFARFPFWARTASSRI